MIRVAKEDSIFSSTRNLTSALSSRVECGNFFWSPRTGRSTNQRSGMILKSKSKFSAHAHQSFHFQKIPGGPNMNIFDENWHEASFYIKEQTQIQIWTLTFKKYHFGPPKSVFMVFKENQQKKFFFVFQLWFRFKNNRRTNVLLVGNFENAQKRYWPSKTVFCAFPKILIKITFVCLLF